MKTWGFFSTARIQWRLLFRLFQVVSTILTSFSLPPLISTLPPASPCLPSLGNNSALESSERPALFLTMASFDKEITVIKNNKLRILKGLPL